MQEIWSVSTYVCFLAHKIKCKHTHYSSPEYKFLKHGYCIYKFARFFCLVGGWRLPSGGRGDLNSLHRSSCSAWPPSFSTPNPQPHVVKNLSASDEDAGGTQICLLPSKTWIWMAIFRNTWPSFNTKKACGGWWSAVASRSLETENSSIKNSPIKKVSHRKSGTMSSKLINYEQEGSNSVNGLIWRVGWKSLPQH